MSKGFKIATIANGEALSDAVSIAGKTIVGIEMPAAWTTADLTFQAGLTEAGVQELYDVALSGVAVAAFQVSTPAASIHIPVDPWVFLGAEVVKVRSGTSGVPVNQGAERQIKLITIDPE